MKIFINPEEHAKSIIRVFRNQDHKRALVYIKEKYISASSRKNASENTISNWQMVYEAANELLESGWVPEGSTAYYANQKGFEDLGFIFNGNNFTI